MTADGMLSGRRSVVAGGAGAVGGMFVELLLDAGSAVCVVDARPPEPLADGCTFARGDITNIDPRVATELGRADLVVLAVPETVAIAAVAGVARLLAPGALLVDTLSVKSAVVAQLQEHAGHVEALSLNPMFAPSLGLDGRAVAAVTVYDGPRTQELLDVLRAHGGRIVAFDAEHHDEATAVTQALTHAAMLAFGLALAELDADVGALGAVAPPPHLTLLALLARIAGGQPETYWDVQAANPHAARARGALAGAVRRLADAIDADDEADFGALLERIDGVLGDDAAHYSALCADLFAIARPPRASAGEPLLATSAQPSTERPST